MAAMKAEYDPEAKALYVYFGHPGAGRRGSVGQTAIGCLGQPNVNLDLGHDGQPVGIEFIGVKEIEVLGGELRNRYTREIKLEKVVIELSDLLDASLRRQGDLTESERERAEQAQRIAHAVKHPEALNES